MPRSTAGNQGDCLPQAPQLRTCPQGQRKAILVFSRSLGARLCLPLRQSVHECLKRGLQLKNGVPLARGIRLWSATAGRVEDPRRR